VANAVLVRETSEWTHNQEILPPTPLFESDAECRSRGKGGQQGLLHVYKTAGCGLLVKVKLFIGRVSCQPKTGGRPGGLLRRWGSERSQRVLPLTREARGQSAAGRDAAERESIGLGTGSPVRRFWRFEATMCERPCRRLMFSVIFR
jgi:hypothetical protein